MPKRFPDIFRYFGIGCVTMLVKGRVDPTEFTNNCDKNVYNYKHDLTLANTGNATVLDMQALFFATRLHKINNEFGISCPECVHTTETESTAETKVSTDSTTTVDETPAATSEANTATIKEILDEVMGADKETVATGGESEEVPSLAGFHPNVDAADLT